MSKPMEAEALELVSQLGLIQLAGFSTDLSCEAGRVQVAAAIAALVRAHAAGRMEGLEETCRKQCEQCRAEEALVDDGDNLHPRDRFAHEPSDMVCMASAIRALMADDKRGE